MRRIDYYRWEQGKQKRSVGGGICYGLCLALGKKINGKRTAEDAYNTIEKNLIWPGRIFDEGYQKQKNQPQYSRKKAQEPAPKGRPLIVQCNINADAGWCTRYSLGSYLNPFSWFGNHACLVFHQEDSTNLVLFDPNTGLTGWSGINQLTFSDLGKMLDFGYKRIGQKRPVYAWGFQELTRAV